MTLYAVPCLSSLFFSYNRNEISSWNEYFLHVLRRFCVHTNTATISAECSSLGFSNAYLLMVAFLEQKLEPLFFCVKLLLSFSWCRCSRRIKICLCQNAPKCVKRPVSTRIHRERPIQHSPGSLTRDYGPRKDRK